MNISRSYCDQNIFVNVNMNTEKVWLHYTPFSLTGLPLTGLLVNRTDGVPIIRTVRLTGTECISLHVFVISTACFRVERVQNCIARVWSNPETDKYVCIYFTYSSKMFQIFIKLQISEIFKINL